MKFKFPIILISLFLFAQLQGGVLKKSKTEVEFARFGTYKTEKTEKITGDVKRSDEKSDFKGKGLMGKIAGKLIKKGEKGEIINLTEGKIFSMDHKKKEYRLREIKPLEEISELPSGEGDTGTEETTPPSQEEKKESDVRIIRNEIRVDDTGNTRTINNFPTRQYIVYWVMEWENVNTGKRGKDSLRSEVWAATSGNDKLQQLSQEEMVFQKAYMKKLGIDIDEIKKEVLGLKWREMLSALSKQEESAEGTPPMTGLQELQKIKGFPIVTEGKFYFTGPKQEMAEEEQEEEETDVTDVKGLFGGFAKKALKKKKKEKKDNFAFRFRTELIKYESQSFSDKELKVPANYKLKGS